jgi:hypothetical protein
MVRKSIKTDKANFMGGMAEEAEDAGKHKGAVHPYQDTIGIVWQRKTNDRGGRTEERMDETLRGIVKQAN